MHRQAQMQALPGLLRQLSSVYHKSWPQQSMLTSQPVSLGAHVNTRSRSFSVPQGKSIPGTQDSFNSCFIQGASRKPQLRRHFTQIPTNHALQEDLGDSFRTLHLGFSQGTRPEVDQTLPCFMVGLYATFQQAAGPLVLEDIWAYRSPPAMVWEMGEWRGPRKSRGHAHIPLASSPVGGREPMARARN